MTIHPTDDVITSDVTPHTATRCPGGWAVTWLGDRTVGRNQAITAMLLAEEAVTASRGNLLSDATLKSCRLIDDLARELDLTGEQAIDMVRETPPSAPADAPAKTHDLTVRLRDGLAVITVENETDDHRVYLQVGVGKDLGLALSKLTPVQVQLLSDELTGGAK
jgi:hypothetical protein